VRGAERTERAYPVGAALLGALLAYGILTIWVRPRWALGVYQAGAFLLAASGMIWMAARPFPAPGAWAAGPPAFAAAWGVCQLAAGSTVSRWETWNATLDWGMRAALAWTAAVFLAERRERRRFLDTVLHFGFALSVISVLQMFTSGGKIFWLFPSGYADLVLGPFVYRNQYAAFVETILPLALYRAACGGRRGGWLHWLMAAVMIAAVIAGASRMGSALAVAEAVAIPAALWIEGRMPGRGFAMALVRVAILGAIAAAVVGVTPLRQRFQSGDLYGMRREMVQSSLAMFRERPWTGFGLGTWASAYPAYALYDDGLAANQAHNDWVQWAVEGGVPLVAAMVVFALLLAGPAWRSAWGLGAMAVLLHCLVDYPLQQRPALAGWFFAMAGAVAAEGADRDT
jgi:O-antigen ligase